MTKAELIASLNADFHTVEPEEDISSPEDLAAGFHQFLAWVWDEANPDSIARRGVSFYVAAPGGDTDEAWWQDSDPVPEAVVTFEQEVQAYIDAAIAGGVIEGAFLTKVNAISETAQAEAVVDETGTLVTKDGFFDRDGGGNIQLRVIG